MYDSLKSLNLDKKFQNIKFLELNLSYLILRKFHCIKLKIIQRAILPSKQTTFN